MVGDGTDWCWARTRALDYLGQIASILPDTVAQ